MDRGWRFALGHASDASRDFGFGTVAFSSAKAGSADGPASARFDDRTWRTLDLPHDWAVELPFDRRGDGNHGSKAIGRNFPENSVGWYRKTFSIPKEDEGRRIGIDFDGVYRDAQVWVNGFYLGNEHSGYDSFHYDMTDYLNYGGSNVLVVRANATVEEGWFYEGAGIYRHVWLTKTAPVHVAHDGTFVTTAVADPAAAHVEAQVTAELSVENESEQPAEITVDEEVEDAAGAVVAASRGVPATVAAAGTGELKVTLPLRDARLWSLESPYLHRLVTTLHQQGRVVDRYETSFGIRTIHFDPNQGFFLNGKRVELKGTDLHQDHAGVGVAVPDGLQVFRIAQLKAFGSNAIRSSHNPPAPAMLDACDRMGMLVLDENRMMGTNPEGYEQLRSMIVRDRNHPSVILWSVGNEEWALENSVFGEKLTRDTEAFAKRLDPTRLSTIALSSSGRGASLATGVFGFNYFIQHNIDAMHARFPERPVVGTEESSSEHTRGVYMDDRDHQHLTAVDVPDPDKHATVEASWRFHSARPFSAGLFYWTGMDYRGEPTPFDWPAIGSQFGMLDSCGFFKDNAYLLESWWTEKPMVHLLPHWTWPGREGQPIDVRVYSNAAAVELTLNDNSLGRQQMPSDGHLEWRVNYAPGRLSAQGFDAAGRKVASDAVETTTAPARVVLKPSDTKMGADGVSVITVEVEDAKGRLVPDAESLVSFEVAGPARILGVGNGDPSSHEPDQYVETVATIPVGEWRTRPVESISSGPESAPEFDDSAWEKARDPRWNEHRVDPTASVYRGSFNLPEGGAGRTVELVLRSVGETQSIYVNGHALGEKLAANRVGYQYMLDPAMLHPGRNVVTIYATRFAPASRGMQGFQWGRTGPAAVRMVTPAPTWQRSVFHGLAEVIVQSGQGAGRIRLTASAPSLTQAVLEIEAP
ncbi:MAG TPA: beta-galactosidase GalA [Acidobacteriaceae bacterium]